MKYGKQLNYENDASSYWQYFFEFSTTFLWADGREREAYNIPLGAEHSSSSGTQQTNA
jgi:hypothetical protein